jgi:hypothetical protein
MASIDLSFCSEIAISGLMPSVVTGSKKFVRHLIDHMTANQSTELAE